MPWPLAVATGCSASPIHGFARFVHGKDCISQRRHRHDRIGAGMAFYEWFRIKAGRPILKGSLAIQLYWVAYFSMFVLGVTFALAAMFK